MPIFRIKSVKIYTGQKNLHLIIRYESRLRGIFVFCTKSQNDLISVTFIQIQTISPILTLWEEMSSKLSLFQLGPIFYYKRNWTSKFRIMRFFLPGWNSFTSKPQFLGISFFILSINECPDQRSLRFESKKCPFPCIYPFHRTTGPINFVFDLISLVSSSFRAAAVSNVDLVYSIIYALVLIWDVEVGTEGRSKLAVRRSWK